MTPFDRQIMRRLDETNVTCNGCGRSVPFGSPDISVDGYGRIWCRGCACAQPDAVRFPDYWSRWDAPVFPDMIEHRCRMRGCDVVWYAQPGPPHLCVIHRVALGFPA